MEKILEVRRSMCCLRCNQKYDAVRRMYLTEKCDHHVCFDCYRGRPSTCLICESTTKYKEMPFISEAAGALDQCMKMINEPETENQSMNNCGRRKRKNWQLKQQQRKTCVECKFEVNNQRMHLCERCHKSKTSEDVRNHAICPDCTIKNHMRKGHLTIDFLPRLNALVMTEYKTQIAAVTEKLEESKELMNVGISQYDIVSKSVTEKIDELTNVAKKIDSSKCQIEIFGKIGSLIDESKASKTKMNDELEKNLKNLQDDLTKIQHLYSARKNEYEEDCKDDVLTKKQKLI